MQKLTWRYYFFVLFGLAAAVGGAMAVQAATLSEQLKGRILLQVESRGEAWYVNPVDGRRHFMGRPDDAFGLMRNLGLGISNANLAKIPKSGESGWVPNELWRVVRGRILLQVEAKGEAWYVNPVDGKRYFMGRPADAFSLMRTLGLGITNANLAQITEYGAVPTSTTSTTTTVPTTASIIASTVVPTGGRTLYVATTGSDTGSGSAASPWKTPGYASRQLQAGDTLIIKSGKYVLSRYDEDIVTPPSGTASAWIVIKGEDGQPRPILAGRDNLLTAVNLSNTEYIKLERLEITSDNGAHFRDGIEALDGPAEHIVLNDLMVHRTDEFGLNMADVNDMKVVLSTFTYNGFGGMGGPAGSNGGWRNVEVHYTSLSNGGHYYQGKYDKSPFDRPDGFGTEESEGPIEFNFVYARNNYGDGIDSKVRNTYIHDSFIENNSADGLKLWGTGSKAENVLIYGRGDGDTTGSPWSAIVIDSENPNATFELTNLTVDDEIGRNYLMHIQYDHPSTATNVTIKNSIFSSRGENAPIFISNGTNFTMTNNIFYTPQSEMVVEKGSQRNYTSSQVSELGSGNLYGDPLFVRTGFGTIGDYHLQSASTAAGKGSATLP